MSGGRTREKRHVPLQTPSFKHARRCPASPRKGSHVPKQSEGERSFLIPDSLDILGHKVIVQILPRETIGGHDGDFTFREMRIRLASDDCGMPSTLLHEIIEAIGCMLELKMKHSVVCGIEAGLYQVFTANYRKMVELFYREGGVNRNVGTSPKRSAKPFMGNTTP